MSDKEILDQLREMNQRLEKLTEAVEDGFHDTQQGLHGLMFKLLRRCYRFW